MFILIGNIFDNLKGTKLKLLVGIEITMAFCLLTSGLLEREIINTESKAHRSTKHVWDLMILLTECAASGIIVITLV